jgi:hypothetical protein
MTEALPRALLALAARCLGERRREWALAMEAELDAARADGRALAFALGCLTAAWSQLPAHAEGRLLLARNALALVLIVPAAALLVSTVLAGFPLSYLGSAGVPLVNVGNQSAVPPLAALVLLLAGAQLRLAWLLLERDWARVAATGMAMAGTQMALLVFTAVAFTDCAAALTGAAALAAELAAVAALAGGHMHFAEAYA